MARALSHSPCSTAKFQKSIWMIKKGELSKIHKDLMRRDAIGIVLPAPNVFATIVLHEFICSEFAGSFVVVGVWWFMTMI
jgi:hypothetical protein